MSWAEVWQLRENFLPPSSSYTCLIKRLLFRSRLFFLFDFVIISYEKFYSRNPDHNIFPRSHSHSRIQDFRSGGSQGLRSEVIDAGVAGGLNPLVEVIEPFQNLPSYIYRFSIKNKLKFHDKF